MSASLCADILTQEIIIKRGCDPLWDIHATFYDGGPESAVAIIVPGFGARVEKNKKIEDLAHVLAVKNISALTYNYSGTHYDENSADSATFETHVDDTRKVIAHLKNRGHVLLSRSYGINVAFAAMNAETKGIVCTVPAPDFFKKNVVPYFRSDARLEEFFNNALRFNGYCDVSVQYAQKKEDRHVKISEKFFHSAIKDSSQLHSLVAVNPSRPPVVLIPNANDQYFLNADNVCLLNNQFNNMGFNCSYEIASGDSHQHTPDTLAKAIAAVEAILLHP